MSGIRAKDTQPEWFVRRYLHARGYRYRLHDRKLPGTPDLVLPRWHAVIFVHGCFWHGHKCKLFKLPATRTEFWYEKIHANVMRDRSAQDRLHAQGWRTGIVWECAIKGRSKTAVDSVMRRLALWIESTTEQEIVIDGSEG